MKILNRSLRTCIIAIMLSCFSSVTAAQDQMEGPSPLYLKVMQNWAQVTDFAINAAQVAVDKFVFDLKKDPQIAPHVTKELILDLNQFFYELFISQETMTALAKIYSEYFTIDEMQELITFYQTPIGKKLIKTRAEITRQTQVVGDQLLKSKEKEFIEIVSKHISKFIRSDQTKPEEE